MKSFQEHKEILKTFKMGRLAGSINQIKQAQKTRRCNKIYLSRKYGYEDLLVSEIEDGIYKLLKMAFATTCVQFWVRAVIFDDNIIDALEELAHCDTYDIDIASNKLRSGKYHS